MAQLFLRRVLIGLTVLVGPISFPALSQDYIDVEAERAAAERARAAGAPPMSSSPPSDVGQPTTSTASPYGSGVRPATQTRMLPPPPPPAQDSVGGVFNQVQRLQQEVMRLNGVVEQLSFELNQLKEQSLERYLDIDRRLSGGAGSAGAAVSRAATESRYADDPGDVSGESVEVQEQPGEGEAYRAAYALVRGQEFDSAVTAFVAFLERFPDGRYAPNAHYWLGELYLVQEPPDPEAARQAFMLLVDQYPKNSKVPDAMYKLGRVYFMKGNNDRAREFLNQTIRNYPDSSAARLAGDFLDQNL